MVTRREQERLTNHRPSANPLYASLLYGNVSRQRALTIDKTASFSSCRTAHLFFIFALAYHFFFIFFATLPRVLFSYTNFGRTEKFPFFVSEIWHTLFVNTNTLCVIFKPREDDRKPVTSKFQERIITGLLIVRSIPS